jgi:hypothetical protein
MADPEVTETPVDFSQPERATPAAPERGRARRRGGPGTAAIDASLTSAKARRFLIAVLASGAALVLLVGAFNALVDSYGVVGTHLFPTKILTDREFKADLAAGMKRPPDVLIFGSSRAWKLNPALIQRATGRTAFNAAVSGGSPSDAWAFTSLFHDRFPQARYDFLWIFDATGLAKTRISAGVRNTPSLRRYFSARDLFGSTVGDIGLLFSWSTLKTSLETLRNLKADRATVARQRKHWSPDGWYIDLGSTSRATGPPPWAKVKYHIRVKGDIYRKYRGIDPQARRYFEQTMKLFASWGGRGLVVIDPSEPRLVAALRPLGYEARHREVLAYLAAQQKLNDFKVIDFSTIDKYGGSSADFQDGVHLRTAGMERLMKKVLQRTGGTIP